MRKKQKGAPEGRRRARGSAWVFDWTPEPEADTVTYAQDDGLIVRWLIGTRFGWVRRSGDLAEQAGTGPEPKLPEPRQTLIPTVNIAPAEGWPAGAKPTPAAGLSVTAYAIGLDHPRWLYVLPNGDVACRGGQRSSDA
jgi:hypothetical protein